MTRQDYIAGLENIRVTVKQIDAAFAGVDLTDATTMEGERHKKTGKLISDLCDRLYEDIAVSEKVAADNAEAGIGEQGDLFEGVAEEAADAAFAEAETKLLPAPAPEEPADDGTDGEDGPEQEQETKRGKRRGRKGGAQ